MQWQPIETAPKDGTWILVHDGFCPDVCQWHTDGERWVNSYRHDIDPEAWMQIPEWRGEQ